MPCECPVDALGLFDMQVLEVWAVRACAQWRRVGAFLRLVRCGLPTGPIIGVAM